MFAATLEKNLCTEATTYLVSSSKYAARAVSRQKPMIKAWTKTPEAPPVGVYSSREVIPRWSTSGSMLQTPQSACDGFRSMPQKMKEIWSKMLSLIFC